MPRIPRVVLVCHGILHVRDHADRGLAEERIEPGGRRIRNRQHVGDMDPLPPPDGRTVEPHPVHERVLVPGLGGEGAVLPRPEQVGELQVHHLGVVLPAEIEKGLGSPANNS